MRNRALSDLENAVRVLDPSSDISKFVETARRADRAHKFSKALDLLDWDYEQRYRFESCP